jgi:hypothetical protein
MLHCFLLSKALFIEIDEKTISEGLEPRVRGALAEILCQESIGVDGSLIRVSVFVLCLVASHIPNHFGDSWPIPPLGIKA